MTVTDAPSSIMTPAMVVAGMVKAGTLTAKTDATATPHAAEADIDEDPPATSPVPLLAFFFVISVLAGMVDIVLMLWHAR
jgi:hypothetical protein